MSVLREIAVRLTRGILVGMGSDEEVRAARRSLADLDNCMFIQTPEDGVIPWRDGFFSRIVTAERTAETERVLASAGNIHIG